MIGKCRHCGGSIEWNIGDAAAVCRDCGAHQPIEKAELYDRAGLLADEGTEASLTAAMELYASLRGWRDADARCARCRTRLGQMRWQTESARLQEYEKRHEARMSRRKRLGQIALTAALLCLALIAAVALVRFRQYNRALDAFTAGEYERAAAAFVEMGDYRDSRTKVYLSAVALYQSGRYAQALPYFEWLDGEFDNGAHLQRCREHLEPG